MAQVFISYSRKDLSFVEELALDLKNAGFDVWYDVSGIGGGSRWRLEIESAIRNSQFAITVLSPDSIASEWVEREFLFASRLNRKIIPLLYRQCELPLNYLNLNYIDVQGSNYDKNFAELLRALNQYSTSPHWQKMPAVASVNAAPAKEKNTKRLLAVFGIAFVIFGLAVVSPFLIKWIIPPSTATVAPEVPSDAPTIEIADQSGAVTITLTSPPVLPEITASPALSSEFWITYNSDINGNRDIFLLNPVTGETQGVITDRYHDKVGTWSPDGKFLAFESSRVDPNYYQIYLYEIERGLTILLTEFTDCSNLAPTWSPDGKRIVFYSTCENDKRDIYMMNRDGSGRKKLTSGPGENKFPILSPNGNSITFTSTRSGRDQVWLMNADGSNQRVLADGCSSTFSPDGNWIWFSTRCGDSDIQRIRSDGTGLSTIGSLFGQNPSVSPDGQFVVFQSNDDIWIMGVDGSNPIQLTSGGALDGAPSWSPEIFQ